ncbi:hypothetical protein [Burkholderia diffusa]|uniref:Arginine:ornithine antiporter n=1 Tax=Burkholderia diffusa TaxID=488732 RepID=A0A6P2QWG6_9BURK|nr:hypothetical protein [Burkholderia diffusa]KAB0657271.1 hypothetical protein F7R23_11475 [Burkholderia diffusa]MBM2654873.1 hypothetical protein [Burkholderia diffusa]VWC23721.1 hypothetical protein BDI24065_06001 [Burkholderia diffusa]
MFWAAMDLLYLARYLWLNVVEGKIPFVADILRLQNLEQPTWYAPLTTSLSLGLTCFIAVTAYLFLTNSWAARPMAYVQIPFRLLLAVPSLSFIPWLLNLFGSHSLVLNIALLIASESVKVLTLYRSGRLGGRANQLPS